MARVLEREPDWTLLPATVPPSIRALIERCLAKDPKARLRDIGDARHAIGEVLAGRTGSTIAAAGSPRASRRAWVPWALAGGLAAIAAAGWLRPGAATDAPKRLVRVEIALPENVEFYTSPRISRDARRIAFIGVREGTRAVYVRDLDQALAKPVRGTDGSIFVTFSPDGQSIGTIAADAKLRKIALDSGTTEELASGVDIVGGLTWTADGQLLYGAVTKLLAVPAAGGAPRELVSVRGDETTISNPSTTPDGKTLLFTSWAGTPGALRARIEAAPMGGGTRHVVVDDGGYVLAATPDRLLFQRTGAIYSVAFDAGRVQTTGAPTKVTDEARDSPTGGVAADVTPAGDILFADVHTFNSRLAWVSVEGGVEQTIPAIPRAYYNPRLSPDSHTVAYSDASTIWTTDTVRGAQSRIFVGRDALTGFPIWSHDGAYVFFRTSSGIARLRADGEGAMTLIPGSMRSDYPNAISPDGSTLLMTRISATTSGDIALLPIRGGTPQFIVTTPGYDGGAQFSPDGRWITYVSNISSRMEVYLRPLDGQGLYPVSTSGGLGALWRPDGKRIFFRNGLQFMAVDVTTAGQKVELSAPKTLFEHAYSFGPNITIANYSLSRDGRHFLVVNGTSGHLSLIFNWLGATSPKP